MAESEFLSGIMVRGSEEYLSLIGKKLYSLAQQKGLITSKEERRIPRGWSEFGYLGKVYIFAFGLEAQRAEFTTAAKKVLERETCKGSRKRFFNPTSTQAHNIPK